LEVGKCFDNFERKVFVEKSVEDFEDVDEECTMQATTM
jgi:hypothetical protein